MPRQSNKAPVQTLPKSTPVINKTLPKSTSFIDTIKEGFAFGLGSSIAKNLVNSISSNTEVKRPNNIVQTTPICFEYKKCLESDDKYECFGNLDQKEYVECRTKN
jgi:hypothetical protein